MEPEKRLKEVMEELPSREELTATINRLLADNAESG